MNKTNPTARTRDAATAAKPKAEAHPGTDVATTKKGAPVPAHLAEAMKTDAGQGVSTDQADSMVPLIYILQTNSPQVNPRDPAYIEGAVAGDLWLRNAPQPIIRGSVGILAQPCHFYKEVVEWGWKRGDGFIARHDHNPKHPQGMPADAKEVEDDEGKMVWSNNPGKSILVETRCHCVLVHDPDGVQDPLPYVFPLSGSGHTPSRQWTFMMKGKTISGQIMPSWSMMYRLPTVQKKNAKGQWFMIDPKDAGTVQEPAYVDANQYAMGKAFAEAFKSGEKKAEAPVADTGAGGGSDTSHNDAGGRV